MTKRRQKKRTNKFFIIFLCASLAVVLLLVIFSLNKTGDNSENDVQTDTTVCTTFFEETTVRPLPVFEKIETPVCSSAALYSVDDGQVIYSDRTDDRVAPASLTKLLTASVALKYSNPSSVFTVGSEQSMVATYSSMAFFKQGERLTLYDLIAGMLLASGNDAAYTVAAGVAREQNPTAEMTDAEAISYFCGLMNDFAKELGAENSNFVNPDGWDDDNEYTTVNDMIKIADYALSLPEISELTRIYQKTVTGESGEEYPLKNSNQFLNPESEYYNPDVIGMKTGTTFNAGHNLITAFNKNGRIYLTLVTGCEDENERYDLSLKLFALTDIYENG